MASDFNGSLSVNTGESHLAPKGCGVVRPKRCKRTRRFGAGGVREASSKYLRLGEGLSPIQSVRPGGWPYRPIKGGRRVMMM